jgi:uncharacterized protein (TIGR02597 family)
MQRRGSWNSQRSNEQENLKKSTNMRKNTFSRLAILAIAACPLWAHAVTTSVTTVPEGYFVFNFPATGSMNSTSYLSLPLAKSPTYSGAVASVTANSITVGDSPAPFTAGALSTATTPYFVKFLSGVETGRVVKITSNTAGTLSLDTTDNSPQTVALTASGFTVQPGDTFEVFSGDTLSSVFGANNSASPLILKSGSTIFTADTVAIYNTSLTRWQTYYFSTATGNWLLYGSTANANNTVLYPYGAFTVARRANDAAASLVMTGRVAEVAMLTKTTGSDVDTFSSTKYASDIKLSQLKFGANWTQGTSAFTADTVAVWDSTLTRFDTYYQMPDSTWRKFGSPTVDTSSQVLPAGSVLSILKRSAVSGATSFLQSVLPYSVN